jgi:[ribosomal protein S5]-alanine N-acetyltransferase
MPHEPPPSRTELNTPRLTLFAYKPEQLLALIEQPERFEEIAALTPADGLRGFYVSGEVSPEWVAALRDAAGQRGGPNPWRHGFWIIEKESGEIVGGAGFKGPPDAAGMVEIAYGVVPSREGRGYATEAALALIHFATNDARVRLLRAHTRPEANASTRVLRKCGFVHIGEVVDAEDGPVWRWERSAHHIGTP